MTDFIKTIMGKETVENFNKYLPRIMTCFETIALALTSLALKEENRLSDIALENLKDKKDEIN
tara:strand:- start:917 stop:1105 length:189 start_codon:yes stop_codon:yes gene_type:complete